MGWASHHCAHRQRQDGNLSFYPTTQGRALNPPSDCLGSPCFIHHHPTLLPTTRAQGHIQMLSLWPMPPFLWGPGFLPPGPCVVIPSQSLRAYILNTRVPDEVTACILNGRRDCQPPGGQKMNFLGRQKKQTLQWFAALQNSVLPDKILSPGICSLLNCVPSPNSYA